MRTSIDINCDIGERGMEGAPADLELLPFISSVNVACGGHAGDPETMAAIVRAAMARGVAVGAHPGYADRANFGRVAIPMTADETYAMVAGQIGDLKAVAMGCRYEGPWHVKPHGALYHVAERGSEVSRAILRAAVDVLGFCDVYALSGGAVARLARQSSHLRVLEEVFADRAYLPNGNLAPRTAEGAVITDPAVAAQRVAHWLETGEMEAVGGGSVLLSGDTICIHSDSPGAHETAQAVYEKVTALSLTVRHPEWE